MGHVLMIVADSILINNLIFLKDHRTNGSDGQRFTFYTAGFVFFHCFLQISLWDLMGHRSLEFLQR
jgi:hypothetical protein